ncbi:iron chelate uptake ABC transporter family permease subunit [Pelagovum pacificum]|uniref:Iron chelate uptake ABC transporter family permease subunit n=2 Tax=Pelagovum pacificum TaxID=2588711 RepID=A0A5C5G7W8_9RHOB|nr:iron chelate uptake ABC transporter family permease subunit [Pelagovum pacificum]TNY30776.1 iron chelate uptake ABC transporter family permease subunit [Pelagovum pacificum]
MAGIALLAVTAAYLSVGARGDWGFVLGFRGTKLVALLTVATAIALSTVAFQTLSGNGILTPSVMGFDALYLLIQTGLVFTLSGLGFATLDPFVKFAAETAVMTGAAMLLFGALLKDARDLARMVLTGLILGIMFRSLTALLARMIDPSEYAIAQSASYASFNVVEPALTWVAAAMTLAVGGWLLARHRRLDVISLGRDKSLSLGLDYDREARRLLAAIALLVSVSTALVGPVVFFGLLAAAIARQVAGTYRHAVLLPVSALIASTLLVGSQTLFERILGLQTSVAVVIEALGGLTFLYLIFRRSVR